MLCGLFALSGFSNIFHQVDRSQAFDADIVVCAHTHKNIKNMIGHEYFQQSHSEKVFQVTSIFPNFWKTNISTRHDGRPDNKCQTTTILKMTKGNWSLISWSSQVAAAAAASSQMRRYRLSKGPWAVTPTSGVTAVYSLNSSMRRWKPPSLFLLF